MPNSYQQQSLIIAQILYKYSITAKRKEIKNYYAHIHNAFFKLKKGHPNYFDRLLFDTNGHIPYSKDINDIIQDFQVSGLVNKLNPGFNTLIINEDKLKTLIKKKQNEIPEIRQDELDAMIGELAL